MKILRICGVNLNSLVRFDIDFTQAPLLQSALFGLTGPTGAGKSTILDALCLALYRETPRMRSGRSSNEVPGDGIGANDARNYLRHGAAQAEASVEFEAKGQHFRARWLVRRAKDKASGALQDDKHVLEKMQENGEFAIIEDRRSDVPKAVAKLCGLAYEQFSRAVLLAQGDFAALLRADPAERAALLEKLTGGDIYARIGKQAFAEAKIYEVARGELEAALGTVQLADASLRAEWEIQLSQAVAEQSAQKILLDRAQDAQRWHDKFAQLQGVAQKADENLQAAQRRQAELAVQRAQLAAATQVEPLRVRLQQRDADAKHLAQKQTELADALKKSEQLQERSAQLANLLPQWQQKIDEALLHRAQVEPDLQQASELDGQIASRIAVVQGATADAAAAMQKFEAADQAATAARAALEKLLFLHDKLQAEQAADAQGLTLAQLWPLMQGDLKRLDLQRRSELDLRNKFELLRPQLRDKRLAFERAQENAAQKQSALNAAQTAATAAHDAVNALDFVALRATQKEAADLLSAQQGQKAAAAAVAQAWARWSTVRAELAQVQMRVQQMAAELPLLQSEADAALGALQEAETAAKNASDLLGLDAFVAHLHADEPCPLCGSATHPAPRQSASAQAILAQLQAQLAENRRREKAAQVAILKAKADLQAAEAAQREAARRLGDEEVAARQLGQQWPLGPAFPGDEATAQQLTRELTSQLAQTELALEAASQAFHEAEALQQQHSRAQNALTVALQGLGVAQTALTLAEKQLLELQGQSQNLQQDLARVQQEMAVLELALAPLWLLDATWQKLAADKLLLQLEKRVIGVQERQAQVQKHAESLQGLDTEAKLAVERRYGLQNSHLQAKANADGQQRQLAELQGNRQKLLQGQSVALVRAQLQSAEQAAREGQRLAAEQHLAADQLQKSQSSVASSLRADVLNWTEQTAGSALIWQTQRAQTGLDEMQVLALLALPLSQKAQWQAQLQTADVAVTTAQEAQRIGAQALTLHGQVPDYAQDMQAARSMAAAAQAALAQAQEQAQKQQQLMQMDDTQQLKNAALLARKNQLQGQAQPWEQLKLHIGDAEGKKLRNFAQAIAFSWLVESANLHLAQLRPRYALQVSGPQGLDLLVLDRDQADSLRPANTLSGGETFLVSLALALGLSTLASGPTQCDFLFIDEGFGTLDVDTLDTAFAVLEGLQASGRRVGVVTHVPEAKERLTARIEVTPLGNGRSAVTVVG